MFNKKQDERFKRVYADGGELRDDGRRQILVDTETCMEIRIRGRNHAAP